MIYSLIIWTILYVSLARPHWHGTLYAAQCWLSCLIFEARNMPWIAAIVSVSAIVATASVLPSDGSATHMDEHEP